MIDITNTITNTIDSFTTTVKNIPTRVYVIVYIIITVICVIYMVGERKKMLQNSRNNISSKQDIAIEKFKNYTNELLDEYTLQCNDDIQGLINTDNNKPQNTLKDVYLNPIFINTLLSKIPNTKYDIINMFLFNTNKDIIDLNDTLNKYTDILLKSANTYINDNSDDIQINNVITTNFMDILNNNIESQFKPYVLDRIINLIDLDKNNITQFIDWLNNTVKQEFIKEVKIRLFYKLRTLSRTEYIKLCNNKNILNETDTGILNNKLSDTIDKQHTYNRNILYIMAFLIDDNKLLKQETENTYNKSIIDGLQPKSEEILTNIQNASKNKFNSASYSEDKEWGDSNTTSAYANQYNNYIINQSKKDLEMLINPLNSIDNLEKGTVNILEKIHDKIYSNNTTLLTKLNTQTTQTTQTTQNKGYNMLTNETIDTNNTIQNNYIDTTNRGTFLLPNDTTIQTAIQHNKINNPITIGNNIRLNTQYTNPNIKEGFQTNTKQLNTPITSNLNKSLDTKLNKSFEKTLNKTFDKKVSAKITTTTNTILVFVNSFIAYINESILPLLIDSDTRRSIMDLFQNDENSMSIGILLIGLSVILFFIQITNN